MKIGLVGYGVGGQFFHAPYIDAADGTELAGIVVRSPGKREIAAANYPGVPLFESLSDLIDSGVDAVTITTPPETRQGLVLRVCRGTNCCFIAVLTMNPWLSRNLRTGHTGEPKSFELK